MSDTSTELPPRSWDPVARGPFLGRLLSIGAQIERIGAWQVAMHVPGQPLCDQQLPPVAISDVSCLPKCAFYGKGAPHAVASALGLPGQHAWGAGSIGESHSPSRRMCVLHAREVIVIDHLPGAVPVSLNAGPVHAVDCTGGLASLALFGDGVIPMLRRLTAMDLTDRGFPVDRCAQTKVAEVRGLVLHLRDGYYQLHVDRADAEHLWDALMAAGRADGIQPIGWTAYRSIVEKAATCRSDANAHA